VPVSGHHGPDRSFGVSELAVRLAQRFPDRWDGVSGEALSADARGPGVPSVDLQRKQRQAAEASQEH
jgi:hypothetical protein